MRKNILSNGKWKKLMMVFAVTSVGSGDSSSLAGSLPHILRSMTFPTYSVSGLICDYTKEIPTVVEI